MPHKRAKRSVREKLRSQQGTDLPPAKQTLVDEHIPKSAARILNAMKIRQEWKASKKLREEASNECNKAKRMNDGESNITELRILPGESIEHFNRRVEDDMRPLIKSALSSSHAVADSIHKDAKPKPGPSPKPSKFKNPSKIYTENANGQDPSTNRHQRDPTLPAKEFPSQPSSTPKRLNDIAKAPLELPRGVRSAQPNTEKVVGVISMAQRTMMKEERDRVVRRYRELKALRLLKKNVHSGDGGSWYTPRSDD